MKARVILIPLAVIAAAIVIYIAAFKLKAPASELLDIEKFAELSDNEQDELLKKAFSEGWLPNDKETEFLIRAFTERPESTQALLKLHSKEFPGLPRQLSDAALELFKEKNTDAGLAALSTARELYPNDPDVLGVTGIIAYLGGRSLDARQFLEEAESWRQHRPLIDFYLGGILILSDSTADRTRGKNLLMRVLNGNDSELKELAGLSLLGNNNIPMIPEDIKTVYATLSEDSVFRVDNPNLSAEVIRILLNRIVPYMPDEALPLADLLMKYPESSMQDRLGIIQLAQRLGKTEMAEAYLSSIDEGYDFEKDSKAAMRVERIKAVQLFMQQEFEEGLQAVRDILNSQPNSPEIQNLFEVVMAYELPLQIERELLKAYLELPVTSVRSSLSVIARLMTINPLGEDQWIDYATEKLLHREPIQVGQWLTTVGAAGNIIRTLSGEAERSSNENLLLVNSYLEVKDPDKALATLEPSEEDMDPTIVAYLRSRILDQQGKKEKAFEFWKDAYQGATAGKTFPLLKNLGILAMNLNQNVSAFQALYTAFSAGIPFSPAEGEELLNLTLRYGNLQQSIEVASYLADTNPEENGYINNLFYFRFLAEEKMEEGIEKMRSIVEDIPDVPEFRLTLALGLLKTGRINEADRLIQSTNVDWNNMGTRGQMIYAAVLAATDKRILAEGLIQNMNLEDLIPEEKALLEAF